MNKCYENGRKKALAAISNGFQEAEHPRASDGKFGKGGKKSDHENLQKELTSRLGMKIYDYVGIGQDTVSIKPSTPGNVRQLIEAAAKAHGFKIK